MAQSDWSKISSRDLITRRVYSIQQWFSTLSFFIRMDPENSIEISVENPGPLERSIYDSPLQAKQNLKTCRKIYRRVSWHTQGFERLHCFVSLCNEFLSCYKISVLGVTCWPSDLYVQRSVLPQERPRILSTQGSGEKLFCKMWKQGESSWSARCVNSWMLISFAGTREARLEFF